MKYLLTALLFFPLLSFAQKGGTCVLKGHLTGLGNDTVTISWETDSIAYPYKEVKVNAHNDNFTYKTHLREPALYKVSYFKAKTSEHPRVYRFIKVYLENGNVTLNGTLDSLSKAKVTGSAIHAQWYPLDSTLNAFSDAYADPAEDSVHAQEIRDKNTRLEKEEAKFVKDAIASHAHSIIGITILRTEYDYYVKPSESAPLFASLDPQIQKTVPGILFKHKLDVATLTDSGSIAPDVSLADTTGKALTLSSYRGHLVLLDFWASWCGPCRQENPNVRQSLSKISRQRV